jgi:hypothetical protein
MPCNWKRCKAFRAHVIIGSPRKAPSRGLEDSFCYYSLQSKPNVRIVTGFLLFLGGPVFVFGVALVEITALYGPFGAALFSGIVRGPVSVFVLLEVFHQGKMMFLKQDRCMAKTVGTKSLLDIFQKIDLLGLPDVENGKKRKGWIAWIWPMPNMTERIDNLTVKS